MFKQYNFTVSTPGRGLIDITSNVAALVAEADIATGLCHVFLHHTSASLIISENADPLVLKDLEAFMLRLVPDGDPLYTHVAEGHDDMPAHVRAMLTQSFLVLPVTSQRIALGTWQGIFLWEHRLRAYERKLTVTIQGIPVES